MSDAAAPRDHFAQIAPSWSQLGPPLRPWPGDVAIMQRVVATLAPAARVVVLGLTPEIVGCDWPAQTDLVAVDHSPAMIARLWPPERGPAGARSMLADWSAMPIAPGSIDCVAGDGCYVVLPHPHGFAALTREVRRVLRPGGLFAIRVFVRPDHAESIADVAQALAAGQVGSVHALKLRLLAAVHGASGVGSRLDDVWRAWRDMADAVPAALTTQRGWTSGEIVGIEAYRGMDARYYLPTVAEFRAGMHGFDEIECATADEELGARCPTFVLRASR